MRGVYQVCLGRISSCEEGKGIRVCGEENNVEKGKGETIYIFPIVLGRISIREDVKGTKIFGKKMKIKFDISRLLMSSLYFRHVKKPEQKAVWEKSIGSLSTKKGGLGMLVKKKSAAKLEAEKSAVKLVKSAVKPEATFKMPAPAPKARVYIYML